MQMYMPPNIPLNPVVYKKIGKYLEYLILTYYGPINLTIMMPPSKCRAIL